MSETKLIPAELHKNRLDTAIAEIFGISKSSAHRAIVENRVLRNGKLPKKAGEKITKNDEITLKEETKGEHAITEKLLPPQILFENEDFLIVEKPIGIPTHFDEHHTDCLVARLLAAGKTLASVGAPDRPGVVHRLDKDTSGILLFAKTDAAHQYFQNLFATRKIKKTYYAVVYGGNLPAEGTIDSPIGRDPRDRKKMRVAPENVGRKSLTHFRVLENREATALVEVDLATGRTHQIRVHFAAIGHPVVGDPIYGHQKYDEKTKPSRLFLHAAELEFVGSDGKEYRFLAEVPKEFKGKY